ncbi:MAG: DEAD/DEAH box helicase, partial [Proteobacteria bacterium]
MKTFQDLKSIPEGLKRALAELNFSTPTPIQAEAIPLALEGGDLIGCAQTGSGKTVAFSVPMITKLIEERESIALILVPTRELAAQVVSVVEKLIKFNTGIGVVTLIGGVPMNPQIRALARRPRIVVATPGRLIDHLQSKNLSLGRTAVLVLDEADRMLDMGFAPQL